MKVAGNRGSKEDTRVQEKSLFYRIMERGVLRAEGDFRGRRDRRRPSEQRPARRPEQGGRVGAPGGRSSGWEPGESLPQSRPGPPAASEPTRPSTSSPDALVTARRWRRGGAQCGDCRRGASRVFSVGVFLCFSFLREQIHVFALEALKAVVCSCTKQRG